MEVRNLPPQSLSQWDEFAHVGIGDKKAAWAVAVGDEASVDQSVSPASAPVLNLVVYAGGTEIVSKTNSSGFR